jgi:pimeloyl-ACP methyl ester carboxylesterase
VPEGKWSGSGFLLAAIPVIDMAQRTVGMLVLAAMTAGLVGCAGTDGTGPRASGPPSPVPTAADPLATPSVDGRFPVGDGRLLALRCWGSGSPTVVYGGGGSGIAEWSGSSITEGLVSRTRVCLYNHSGAGLSDPPPNRKRLLDDVVRDEHELLAAARISPPYLMVGQSGGGFVAYHYAGRYPGEVAGLVLLDVPAGQARMSAADVAELAWDSPGNLEHVDYVAGERQMALHRLPIPRIPVTVITARGGQSAPHFDEQRVWLQGSSHPVQVVLDGGHNIDQDDPVRVLAEIQKVLTLVS